MKKLLVSLALLLGVQMYGQSILSANIGALTNNISTNRLMISQVTITAGDSTNLIVKLFDNNASANVYTNGLYYTKTLTSGTVTNKWTNDLGMVLTNYYVGLVSSTVTNAAATNQLPVLAQITVASNSTVTATFEGLFVSKGLTYAANSTNATMTVTYKTW